MRGLGLLIFVMLAATVAVWALGPEDPARLVVQARAAAQAGQWKSALEKWREVNRTSQTDVHSYMGEAQACLALSLAAQAERALVRANEAVPADPAPWLLRLSLLHAEDRTIEAQQLGWSAYHAVGPLARRDILQALTRVLLSDVPDDAARDRLGRWIAADGSDIDAQVALLARISVLPRAGDPARAARIATLSALLARKPRHVATREALVNSLADAGEPDQGRSVLDAWPDDLRDARYLRLQGRWDLEYDHQPVRAVIALGLALAELPHDWRTHYRLSRALNMLGKTDQAHHEAETVARLREALDPAALGRRLASDFENLNDPESRLNLASLCSSVGLLRLAEAWRADAAVAPPSQPKLVGQSVSTSPTLRMRTQPLQRSPLDHWYLHND